MSWPVWLVLYFLNSLGWLALGYVLGRLVERAKPTRRH